MKIVFLAFLFLPMGLMAQTRSQIATGRPGQAIGSNVLGTGLFQIQSGFDYNRIENTNLGLESKTSQRTINNILRLGLSEDFEVSSILDYRDETQEVSGVETSQNGVQQFQLGFRYNLIPDPKGWVPAIGFQTRFRLKQVSSTYQSDQTAPVMILATGHDMSDRFSLNLNGSYSTNGNSNIPVHGYVVSLSQKISSIFSTVYEAYGNESNDETASYLGFGVAYRMNRDTQLDTYISSGNNQGLKEFYFTIGVSWRVQLFESLMPH